MRNLLSFFTLMVLAAMLAAGPAFAAKSVKAKPPRSDEPQSGAPGQEKKAEPRPADPADADAPMLVFGEIERAWNASNVDQMLRHFGTGKVSISITGAGSGGGTFSRNQSHYLFKDLFSHTATRKFEFVQFRQPGDAGGESFAIAERHYQKSDDGRLFKDKVYVSLRREHESNRERWVVDEIKSIR